MVAPLDVFALLNREPKWLGCVETLAQATEMLRRTGYGRYLVFSQQTGRKDFYQVATDGIVSQVSAPAGLP
jgi:hypothetical protein